MSWILNIQRYCEAYNIPLEYLAQTLSEPKVVPMIRGKAFEFSVLVTLQGLLNGSPWKASKTAMNAQLGAHDIDVCITHVPTQRDVAVECKLAAKGRFRHRRNGTISIAVKCMRSRTLGAAMVAQLAPIFGVSAEQLQVHNDQYLPKDFDLVITSIGNAFYQTDPETGTFVWSPTEAGITFLERLREKYGVSPEVSLKDFAFSQMYVAKASSLATNTTGTACTRKTCTERTACGFIPNYPLIEFGPDTLNPLGPWHHLSAIPTVLHDFV